MRKSEIVCKIGSGVLAPTIIIASCVAGTVVSGIIWNRLGLPQPPMWFVKVSAVALLISVLVLSVAVYRKLFYHCRKWRHE